MSLRQVVPAESRVTSGQRTKRVVTALLLTLSALAVFGPSPAIAHPSDHLATFDSFAEGGYGTQITDGGITFFALDVRAPGNPNPLPPPNSWVIERADEGRISGLPGFTPPNALGCCGIAPGPSAAFGRIGEFRMTTGSVETDASLELYTFTSSASSEPPTTVTLEAIRNGVVAATHTVVLGRISGRPEHHHLEISGVEFDQLRVSASSASAFPVFFGLIDTVRISNRGVRPAECVPPQPPPAGAIFATPGMTAIGTPADDVIYGTSGNDRIAGMGGNDTIFGMGGNDQLAGGEGNDVLCGGEGDDWLSGSDGNDLLSGDAGRDDLSGGLGDDRLFGGPDGDRLTGGEGFDRCAPGGQADDAAAGPPSCDVVS